MPGMVQAGGTGTSLVYCVLLTNRRRQSGHKDLVIEGWAVLGISDWSVRSVPPPIFLHILRLFTNSKIFDRQPPSKEVQLYWDSELTLW